MSGSHIDQHPYLYDEDFDMGAKELAHDVLDDDYDDTRHQMFNELFPSLDWSEPLFIDDDDENDLLVPWDDDDLEGETDF